MVVDLRLLSVQPSMLVVVQVGVPPVHVVAAASIDQSGRLLDLYLVALPLVEVGDLFYDT